MFTVNLYYINKKDREDVKLVDEVFREIKCYIHIFLYILTNSYYKICYLSIGYYGTLTWYQQ